MQSDRTLIVQSRVVLLTGVAEYGMVRAFGYLVRVLGRKEQLNGKGNCE